MGNKVASPRSLAHGDWSKTGHGSSMTECRARRGCIQLWGELLFTTLITIIIFYRQVCLAHSYLLPDPRLSCPFGTAPAGSRPNRRVEWRLASGTGAWVAVSSWCESDDIRRERRGGDRDHRTHAALCGLCPSLSRFGTVTHTTRAYSRHQFTGEG